MIRLFYSLLFILMTLSVQGQLLQDLSLKYLIQLPKSKVVNAPVIILLHGYGSNESDLFELKGIFPAKYLIVSVRAPYPINQQGYQWFPLGGGDKSHETRNSSNLMVQFISQVTAKYKADKANVHLIGFSQGAMMCYEVGLLNPGIVKDIAPLSGRLNAHIKTEVKHTDPRLKQLRVFIAHGTTDERISFNEGKAASNYLAGIGIQNEFHEYPGMGHSISNGVLKDLLAWLH